MRLEREELSEREKAQRPHRETYATPELTVHGSVEEITQRATPGGGDGYEGSPGLF